MIEENERAAKFMQAIQRDGEKRRTAIIQSIDEEIAAELEKVMGRLMEVYVGKHFKSLEILETLL